MPFVVDKATPADIPALTSILLADDPPSPFTQLMLGAVDARAINMRLAARTAKGIDDPTEMWLVARDEQTKKTASFAQWQLPRDEADDDDDDDDLSEADLVRLSVFDRTTWGRKAETRVGSDGVTVLRTQSGRFTEKLLRPA